MDSDHDVLELVENVGLANHSANNLSILDKKALLRRIDRKILPMLFIVYVAAFLDRVNIANALTMNLPKDLGLTGNQANVALTIFYVPYVLFEIPSNIMIRRLKPHLWLSACILTFGTVMLAQGFVQSYGGLLATRFLLGLAESGIFPGSFYLISFGYKREEAQKRFTFYWCSVLVANMFRGLLASAIANMNGVGGYSNWEMVFILEGIATIFVGVAAFFFLGDFPDEAKWLTKDERAWVIARTTEDKGLVKRITMRDVLCFFSEIKHILGAIIYFSILVPTYNPGIFDRTDPIAHGASGRSGTSVGYYNRRSLRPDTMLISVHNVFSVEYAGICLVAMGAFAAGPIVICWFVMNLHGHAERSIGTAWMIAFGNTGGIVATFAFLATDAPRYVKGYTVCLTVVGVGLVAAIAYGFIISRENRKLRAASRQQKVKYYSP
ncbi:hypothetical protein MMC13_004333 [Lambiella insularis]|nr:hypothetical protein [Lambiella insularis]